MVQRRKLMFVLVFMLLIVASYIGWWLISPLFFDGDTGKEEINLDQEQLLYHGVLNTIDANHGGEGDVYISLQNGAFKILFVDVDITNGPDLYIYLSKKTSFSGTSDSAGQYQDLGELEFTQGNFSVPIPPHINVDDYSSVLIWCKAFSVVFTWAYLMEIPS